MKKIIGILFLMMCTVSLHAQTNKDTVRVDTSKVEKINRVPADTSVHNMPVAPLLNDTSEMRKSRDDEDPVRRRED